MSLPITILLVSGKRKCGKDYICGRLKSSLEECTIIRISEPIKHYYAKLHNLNFNELMSDSIYKEKYRVDMINWSDEVRQKDPGYFCQAACSNAPLKPIWIVSDIRRKTDIRWFQETYMEKIKCVRIGASLETRTERGWVFQDGVDNVTSECDLDDWKEWDLKVDNNNRDQAEYAIEQILSLIRLNNFR